MSAEGDRLQLGPPGRAPWRHWGPYLSERGWGTVREDYSATGHAWEFFPHDHARSRVYRWNEDGLGGICDDRQTLCFALAFWNGRDPILKERIFGLTGPEGNHGEDAKEYWWFLDSTPTHSWMRWRYMYPQAEFPYARLVDENCSRGKLDPEFELVDTGIFDEGRYWEITADYAKASPEDMLIQISVRNAGPEAATIDVLPTIWFRNTWSWGIDGRTPSIGLENGLLVARHHELGTRVLAGGGSPVPLFCDNETNRERLWRVASASSYPKDGINDHVIYGAPTVNPQQTGTKAALHYHLQVAAGETATIKLRLNESGEHGGDFDSIMRARAAEADEFYGELTPAGTSADEGRVLRQALAGMLWSKQFYHYDVQRWLDGDPAGPPPPESRRAGRNHEWTHLDNMDVISMPDTWEYPWYAAWDLAFHCVALAHVDPGFAKHQLVLLCREWFMHPNGQLPAYEWDFGDVNPPVHAWAALRVFEIAGDEDRDFLERVFHKLLLNFTWWVNRKDAEGNNLFEGGFLGLDNIGPFDRSAVPVNGTLEQSDGTAWMAMYCESMLEIALRLAEHDATYEDLATKFFEHFALIASALNDKGLWNEEDGFYYDVLHTGDGRRRAAARTLDRRTAPADRREHRRTGDDGAPACVHRARRLVHGQSAGGSVRRAPCGLGRPPGLADALDRRRDAPPAAPRPDARPERVPVRSWSARPVEVPRGEPVARLDRRRRRDARLRARRVDDRALRGQLELARAGLVPDQLPAGRDPARVPPLSRRCLQRRVPDRVGPRAVARAGRGRACDPAGRPVPRGPGREAAGLRRLRAVPARPGLA